MKIRIYSGPAVKGLSQCWGNEKTVAQHYNCIGWASSLGWVWTKWKTNQTKQFYSAQLPGGPCSEAHSVTILWLKYGECFPAGSWSTLLYVSGRLGSPRQRGHRQVNNFHNCLDQDSLLSSLPVQQTTAKILPSLYLSVSLFWECNYINSQCILHLAQHLFCKAFRRDLSMHQNKIIKIF